jgi:hypothetical protein
VKQAAEELNISSDAVRKRIARGTLRPVDAIIMQMAQAANAALAARVPELEAAARQREAPETPPEEANSRDVPPEPQERTQRNSWLYRLFFGP